MKNFIKLTMFLFTVSILAFSCEKDNDAQNGNLTLSITDAPLEISELQGLFITVTEVQYHKNDNEWTTFEEFEGPQTFNLLELTEGESAIMGSFGLEPGHYTQLRFFLDAPEENEPKPTNPGCYVTLADSTEEPIYVPSGSESGWKGVGGFTVPINGDVAITADFDARKSVFKTGSDRYILKPTIRLIVDDEAGKIVGGVTNIPDSTTIIIYAYEADTYTSSEADEPSDEYTTRFPNAVTSDAVEDNLGYKLAFLAPMYYDLVVVGFKEGEFDIVYGIVEDVLVVSRETTSQAINILSL